MIVFHEAYRKRLLLVGADVALHSGLTLCDRALHTAELLLLLYLEGIVVMEKRPQVGDGGRAHTIVEIRYCTPSSSRFFLSSDKLGVYWHIITTTNVLYRTKRSCNKSHHKNWMNCSELKLKICYYCRIVLLMPTRRMAQGVMTCGICWAGFQVCQKLRASYQYPVMYLCRWAEFWLRHKFDATSDCNEKTSWKCQKCK